MACFIVPATEAVATTIITKVMEKKEHKKDLTTEVKGDVNVNKVHFSTKLKKLNHLLWGGSFLLAFEHLWHGEVQPFFPFLTATATPDDTAEMLHEMSTVGVSMAVLVTLAWGVITYVAGRIEKREENVETEV